LSSSSWDLFLFFLLFCFALDLQQHFYSFLLHWHVTPMVSRTKLHSHLTRILASCHHTDFLKKSSMSTHFVDWIWTRTRPELQGPSRIKVPSSKGLFLIFDDCKWVAFVKIIGSKKGHEICVMAAFLSKICSLLKESVSG
jgi:hypothetical protein